MTISKPSPEQIAEILSDHSKWLDNNTGKQANLSNADLSEANLSRANLSYANLSYANLSRANLSRANLSYANLSRANLSSANLSRANLSRANLSRANLSWANLSYANLSSVNLSRANLNSADLSNAKNLDTVVEAAYSLSQTEILPREGEIIAWKKCMNGVLVKLRIPSKARRSNATGRKCRAEYVRVLEVHPKNKKAISKHDEVTLYRVGSLVKCNKWDDNRWNECSGGIHFFLTREEAEAY